MSRFFKSILLVFCAFTFLSATAQEDQTEVIKKWEDGEYKYFGEEYFAKTILIATGSKRRQLEAKGADKYEHRGLTYCASCDGLFFAGKDVVVVGAGNSALEAALQLLAYCKSVTILVRGENVRGDEITLDAIKKNPNANIIFNCEAIEVLGDNNVRSLRYKNRISNEEYELQTEGIFIEIGQIPNTEIFRNLVKLNSSNKIEIDLKNNQTSKSGVWAAGDCTDILYCSFKVYCQHRRWHQKHRRGATSSNLYYISLHIQ